MAALIYLTLLSTIFSSVIAYEVNLNGLANHRTQLTEWNLKQTQTEVETIRVKRQNEDDEDDEDEDDDKPTTTPQTPINKKVTGVFGNLFMGNIPQAIDGATQLLPATKPIQTGIAGGLKLFYNPIALLASTALQTGQLLTGWGLNTTTTEKPNVNNGGYIRRRPGNGGKYPNNQIGVASAQNQNNKGNVLDYDYHTGSNFISNSKVQGVRRPNRPGISQSGIKQTFINNNKGTNIDYDYNVVSNQNFQGLKSPLNKPGLLSSNQAIRNPGNKGVTNSVVGTNGGLDYDYGGGIKKPTNSKVSQGINRPIRPGLVGGGQQLLNGGNFQNKGNGNTGTDYDYGGGLLQGQNRPIRPGQGNGIRRPGQRPNGNNQLIQIPAHLLTKEQVQLLQGNQQGSPTVEDNATEIIETTTEASDEKGGNEDEDEDYENEEEEDTDD